MVDVKKDAEAEILEGILEYLSKSDEVASAMKGVRSLNAAAFTTREAN